MTLWEKILLGVMGITIAVYFRPYAKAELERSQKIENKDWAPRLCFPSELSYCL